MKIESGRCNLSTPKISVGMTTYDGENYLQAQLNSFINQNILFDELIVHDDSSADNTVEILKSFSMKASFKVEIKINPINLGYINNFSKVLEKCSGDIVFLSDQDDYWLPNKIERVLHVFEANPSVLLVIHDLEFCDAKLKPLRQTKIQRFRWSSASLDHYVTGMATAIRGDFLRLCLPIPADSYTHDAWLHACAQALGCRLVLPEVLAHYRRHESNAAGDLSINYPGRLSPATMILRRLFNALFGDDMSGLRKKTERSRVLKEWMIDRKPELLASGFCTEDRLSQSLDKLEQDILKVRNRMAIRQLNRMQRILPALKLHLADGFGWRAFRNVIKDVVVK